MPSVPRAVDAFIPPLNYIVSSVITSINDLSEIPEVGMVPDDVAELTRSIAKQTAPTVHHRDRRFRP